MAVEKPEAGAGVQRTGYTGFGSFMTDQSVEEMIGEAEDVYQPPSNPFEEDLSGIANENTPLGAHCRSLFMIDFDNWICESSQVERRE